MRQVPSKRIIPPVRRRTRYGIIGDGRTARHTAHYFSLLGIPFEAWSRRISRNSGLRLEKSLQHCETILLLIKDSAIEDFIAARSFLKSKKLVHFSGSLSTPMAEGAHPLMTFGPDLYDLGAYKSIPFILEKGRASFKELFPELKNPSYCIAPEMKPFYHSLCVISGNFTGLLWRKFFTDLEEKLHIPREAALPYFGRVMKNISGGGDALTGPISRKDYRTLEKDLLALRNDPFKRIFEAFMDVYVINSGHRAQRPFPKTPQMRRRRLLPSTSLTLKK